MVTDPIADYLTRVRNAVRAGHRIVVIPSSKLKLSITHILFVQGFILNYKYEDDGKQGLIKIAMKIDPRTRTNPSRIYIASAVLVCVVMRVLMNYRACSIIWGLQLSLHHRAL